MVLDRYVPNVGNLLVPREEYQPFPAAGAREEWEALSEEARAEAVARGEEHLGQRWPELPATLYMDFARTGDRSHYEGPCFARRTALGALVLAECAEGKGRFLDDIANGVWAICEESSWCIPAHNPSGDALPDLTDPCIDLFASDTGGLLAWTHYLLRGQLDAVSPLLSRRMRDEIKVRILDQFLRHDDYWWMGLGERTHLNNWSPWCASNCLTGALLMEEDPARRTQAVAKAIGIVDRWLDTYHPDGGCDEGPSYWGVAGGALFDCLELLYSATRGQIDVYDNDLIRQIGRYLYRAHISGPYFIDFADCPAKLHIAGGLVYRYGRRIQDREMASLGAWAHQAGGSLLNGSLLRVLPNLFYTAGIEDAARPPFVRDVWLDGIQVMAARQHNGADQGFYLAAKGGHNAESHNHNDVGQCIVYYDGEPVLIDAGVGTYTRQTFSPQRYEIWTMQSAYHNLPTVNGVQQGVGKQYAARGVSYRVEDWSAELSADIASAYPPEAKIQSWRRTCRLVRGADPHAEIIEEFVLLAPTQDISLSLLTPCEPEVKEDGSILLPVAGAAIELNHPEGLTAEVETLEMDDLRLRTLWGDRLYRIVLRPKAVVEEGEWHISLDARG